MNCVDYLYSPSFDESGISNGLWGVFRSYDPDAASNDPIVKKVVPLPNNPVAPGNAVSYAPCPAGQQPKVFNITAVGWRSRSKHAAVGNLWKSDDFSENARLLELLSKNE